MLSIFRTTLNKGKIKEKGGIRIIDDDGFCQKSCQKVFIGLENSIFYGKNLIFGLENCIFG